MTISSACNHQNNLYEFEGKLSPKECLEDALSWAKATDNYPMAQIYCMDIYGHSQPENIDPESDLKAFEEFLELMDPILILNICGMGPQQ